MDYITAAKSFRLMAMLMEEETKDICYDMEGDELHQYQRQSADIAAAAPVMESPMAKQRRQSYESPSTRHIRCETNRTDRQRKRERKVHGDEVAQDIARTQTLRIIKFKIGTMVVSIRRLSRYIQHILPSPNTQGGDGEREDDEREGSDDNDQRIKQSDALHQLARATDCITRMNNYMTRASREKTKKMLMKKQN